MELLTSPKTVSASEDEECG